MGKKNDKPTPGKRKTPSKAQAQDGLVTYIMTRPLRYGPEDTHDEHGEPLLSWDGEFIGGR